MNIQEDILKDQKMRVMERGEVAACYRCESTIFDDARGFHQ